MSPENCTGWAPGLDLPMGECVKCHAQKADHPKALRSAAHVNTNISPAEFRLADSPLAMHPTNISPASSAGKVRPEVVFCRHCSQGLVLQGVESGSQAEIDYACPKCHQVGPKSKTPTGKVHSETHEPKPAEKTINQRAFEDGLGGISPVAPEDTGYMEWYAEGKRRRDEDLAMKDLADGVVEGETEDLPDESAAGDVEAREKENL